MSAKCAVGSAGTFKKVMKVIGTLILIGLLTGVIYSCIFLMYVKNDLMDDVDVSLDDFKMNLSSVIYYYDKDTGEAKEYVTIESREKRTWIDYENIPKDFEHAFVSIEDQRFYTHHGVDWYRTRQYVSQYEKHLRRLDDHSAAHKKRHRL